MTLIPPLCPHRHSISIQTLTSEYQLLTNTLPGHLGECWLCVPPASKSRPASVASPISLLDFLTSLLINCSKPIITATPYLFHIPLFSIADCFHSSGIHFMGTLDSSDCSNTPALSTTIQPISLNVHNASTIHRTQICCCLPAGWSKTCTLLFSSLN